MVTSAIRQTVYLLIFLAIGYACCKAGFLNKERCKGLTNLLIYVFTPAIIITKLQLEPTPQRVHDLAFTVIITLVGFGIAIAIGHLIFRKDTPTDRIGRFSSVYPNCAYMGIPLVEGVLGQEALFYIVILIGVFNVFGFTHGVAIMKQKEEKLSWKSIAFSPAILSVILGVILFLNNVTLPTVVRLPLDALGDCMSPVSMFVAGTSFASTDFYSNTSWGEIAKALAVRLLLIPAVIGLVFMLIPVNPAAKLAILIGMSCPTAALTVAYSIKYDRDDAYASQVLSFCTTASIVTLPLIVWLGNMLIR